MDLNKIYFGDNLEIMRKHIKDESVDLIYLDPPFNSDQNYNIIFQEQNGSRSKSQIKAFKDTWRWDKESAEAYYDMVEHGPDSLSRVMQAFRTMIGESDLLAYLSMMAPRLVELHRVLKPEGSIYLHCDPTASHYLKLLMDAIFNPKDFLNEIIWHYRKWPTGKYAFQRNHDIIFFYSKSSSKERVFNQLYMPRAESTLKRFGNAKIRSGYDKDGNRIPSQMEEEESLGVRQDDVWDIGRVPPVKQLFPTQKPIKLLKRIIEASTHNGDTVLDPFCGCGTTILGCQEMKRRWIGIDITHLSITLIKHRLLDGYGKRAKYKVLGEPVSLPDAKSLAEEDPWQFQWWALGLVGARPIEQKKGADKGIDGRLYFYDEARKNKTKQVIISVKAGHTGPNHIRDLRGVIEREDAAIGVLISMNSPTKSMTTEAASAGFYHSPGFNTNFSRIQILTIKDLFEGKTINYPSQSNVTFKRGLDTDISYSEKESLFPEMEANEYNGDEPPE